MSENWIYESGQVRLGRWLYLSALQWIHEDNLGVAPRQLLQLLGEVWHPVTMLAGTGISFWNGWPPPALTQGPRYLS
jgi:hypothetical protein